MKNTSPFALALLCVFLALPAQAAPDFVKPTEPDNSVAATEGITFDQALAESLKPGDVLRVTADRRIERMPAAELDKSAAGLKTCLDTLGQVQGVSSNLAAGSASLTSQLSTLSTQLNSILNPPAAK
jgi:hypothetical protein